MSDFQREGQKHLDMALSMIMSAMNPLPPPDIYRDASLSLCSEAIAQNLSDASHLKVGAEPRKLSDLIPSHRERFRRLAEQAIATIEPSCYEQAVENTVGLMLNGVYSKPMDDEQMVRETLATFLAEVNK